MKPTLAVKWRTGFEKGTGLYRRLSIDSVLLAIEHKTHG